MPYQTQQQKLPSNKQYVSLLMCFLLALCSVLSVVPQTVTQALAHLTMLDWVTLVLLRMEKTILVCCALSFPNSTIKINNRQRFTSRSESIPWRTAGELCNPSLNKPDYVYRTSSCEVKENICFQAHPTVSPQSAKITIFLTTVNHPNSWTFLPSSNRRKYRGYAIRTLICHFLEHHFPFCIFQQCMRGQG